MTPTSVDADQVYFSSSSTLALPDANTSAVRIGQVLQRRRTVREPSSAAARQAALAAEMYGLQLDEDGGTIV